MSDFEGDWDCQLGLTASEEHCTSASRMVHPFQNNAQCVGLQPLFTLHCKLEWYPPRYQEGWASHILSVVLLPFRATARNCFLLLCGGLEMLLLVRFWFHAIIVVAVALLFMWNKNDSRDIGHDNVRSGTKRSPSPTSAPEECWTNNSQKKEVSQ